MSAVLCLVYLAPPLPRPASCLGVCCPGPGRGIPGPARYHRPGPGVVPSPMESVTTSGELGSDIGSLKQSQHPNSHACL